MHIEGNAFKKRFLIHGLADHSREGGFVVWFGGGGHRCGEGGGGTRRSRRPTCCSCSRTTSRPIRSARWGTRPSARRIWTASLGRSWLSPTPTSWAAPRPRFVRHRGPVCSAVARFGTSRTKGCGASRFPRNTKRCRRFSGRTAMSPSAPARTNRAGKGTSPARSAPATRSCSAA